MNLLAWSITLACVSRLAFGALPEIDPSPQRSVNACVADQLRGLAEVSRPGLRGTSALSQATYQSLLHAQKAKWRRPTKPLVLKTQAGTFSADVYLGGNSSAVFLDSNQMKILKFYPMPLSTDQVDYERYVTEYLLRRGEKVPRIVALVHTHQAPAIEAGQKAHTGDYIVIVKDYFEGLTFDTLAQHFGTPSIYEEIDKQKDRIEETYFGEGIGTFRMWLAGRHPAVSKTLLNSARAKYGDAKEDNLLYMPGDGWVLNDP